MREDSRDWRARGPCVVVVVVLQAAGCEESLCLARSVGMNEWVSECELWHGGAAEVWALGHIPQMMMKDDDKWLFSYLSRQRAVFLSSPPLLPRPEVAGERKQMQEQIPPQGRPQREREATFLTNV